VPTIKDVAREAGVSVATVSRVFNQSTQVREAVAEHVRAVAGRLDYWPNGAARSLITNRTHAIGVVLPDLYGEFFSEVIRGIDLATRRERFQVLLSSSHADTEALVGAVRAMRGRVDGLIAMTPDAESTLAIREFARNFSVVLLDPGVMVRECSTISVANFEGARDMVRHLAGLGHRSIATIRGPVGNIDAEERLRGYRAGLLELGLPSSPSLEIQGDFTEASGYHSAAEILRLEPRPTAVFAGNDYMAIGLMSALHDGGIRLPEDVAVAGFDDIAISQYLSPALTTVRVDAYELGELAVHQLLPLTRALKPIAPHHEVLPTTLVVRESCGSSHPHPVDMRSRRRRSQVFSAPPEAAT
jgi:LacI family transcriptional regulator